MTIAAMLALSVAAAARTQAVDSVADWCERQWAIESASAGERGPRDLTELLMRWKGHGLKCSGTVAYEARLAMAYAMSGDPAAAQRELKSVAGIQSDYGHLVEFGAVVVDYFSVANGAPTRDGVRRLEGELRAFTEKYPRFADGQAMLGGIETTLGKHAEAIKALELGLHSSMDTSGAYRNLAISYAAVGRYEDAIHAADAAYRLDKGLTSDPYFVYAVAIADAGVGKLEDAELALRVIAAKKPEVRRDPEFKKALDFVLARMPQGKGPAR
jgi:tetratricopeptide (TPR) repeat protein